MKKEKKANFFKKLLESDLYTSVIWLSFILTIICAIFWLFFTWPMNDVTDVIKFIVFLTSMFFTLILTYKIIRSNNYLVITIKLTFYGLVLFALADNLFVEDASDASISQDVEENIAALFTIVLTLFLLYYPLLFSFASYCKYKTILWGNIIFFTIIVIFCVGVPIYFDSWNKIYLIPIIISFIMVTLRLKDLKEGVDINLSYNVYKPGKYLQYNEKKPSKQDGLNNSYIFFDKNVQILNCLRQEITDVEISDDSPTLFKVHSFSKQKTLYLKYGKEIYRLEIYFDRTHDKHVFIKNYEFYRYVLLYKYLVKSVFLISRKVGRVHDLDKNKYLSDMFQNNIYFSHDITNEIDENELKVKYRNWIVISGKYGVGKTSYMVNLCNEKKREVKLFNFSTSKYSDIISDVLASFSKFFNSPSPIVITTIILWLFPVTSFILKFVSFDGVYDNVHLIALKNRLYDTVKFIEKTFNFNLDTDNMMMIFYTTLSVLIIATVYAIVKNRDFFYTYNFGTTKNVPEILYAISNRQKSNQKLIVEDVDRIHRFEEIYKILLEISYIFPNDDDDFVGYVCLDVENLRIKYGEYLSTVGYKKCNCQYKSKNKECTSCKIGDRCDFYQLMKKNFHIVNVDFLSNLKNYKAAIKEIDYELYDFVETCDNFRDLKRNIKSYYIKNKSI